MYNTPYTGRVLTRAAFTFGFRLGKFAAAREKLSVLQRDMKYYELSGLAAFNDAYMEAMMFPEED